MTTRDKDLLVVRKTFDWDSLATSPVEGATSTERFTVLLKPPRLVSLKVELADEPTVEFVAMNDGLSVTAKSTTLTVSRIDFVTVAPVTVAVPVTVIM